MILTQATKQWLLPALIALAASALAGYYHNDAELTSRVVRLETQRTSDTEKMNHIEKQVDKLVEWALGYK